MNVAKTFPGLFYWARLPGFAAFCGVAAGICAAGFALAHAPRAAPESTLYIKLLFTTAFFSIAAGILCGRPVFRGILFAVCGAALFAGTELGSRNFYRTMEAICGQKQIFTLTVRITSPVAAARYGNRFRGKVIGADDAEAGRALAGKTLQFTSRGPVPPYGVVTVRGGYSAPRPAAGPFGFDQREHFAVNNIHGSFFVTRVLDGADGRLPANAPPSAKLSADNISYALRTTVHNVINKASSADARGIFHAAFLGEKEHLPNDLSAAFRRAGIVHLLAISGFHAALLYGAVFAALGVIAVPPRTRTIISLAMLWCYLFFIGFIPSLFRATVMVTFFCVSSAVQRKNHAPHSLGIAGTAWLLMSPHSLFAPGFQLSFAATAGIVMLQPALGALTRAVNERVNNKPVEFLIEKTLSPLWVSIAGFAATAPPLLHHFGTVSLYGIFFNLIAIPLMSAAMWLFFIAIVLSPIEILSAITVLCAETVLGVLVYMSRLSGGVSWSEVVVPRAHALQLAAMTLFMVGLCAARKELRGVYALRAGAAAMLVTAAVALWSSLNVKTENLEFKRGNAAVNVVIYGDNTAWIAAHGRKNDIRQLREREIEPLLHRKNIRSVPLFLINEEAEEEAHEFTFGTGHDPQMVVTRRSGAGAGSRRRQGRGRDEPDDRDGRPEPNDGYVTIDARVFVSANGSCSLRIDGAGRARVIIVKEPY